LPGRYLRGIREYRRFYRTRAVPPAYRRWDALGKGAVLGVVGAAVGAGLGPVVIAVWIVPKAVTMFVHAWYVNYLPHRDRPVGRFTSTRVIDARWLQPLTLFHNYHGLHHVYPAIPWHRYRHAFETARHHLVSHGLPVEHTLTRLARTEADR
jgi:fatty acid desaturase